MCITKQDNKMKSMRGKKAKVPSQEHVQQASVKAAQEMLADCSLASAVAEPLILPMRKN